MRLCARVQVHERCRVRNLTQDQVTALTAFLSSPANSPPVARQPLAAPDFVPPPLEQVAAAAAHLRRAKAAGAVSGKVASSSAAAGQAEDPDAPVDRLREIKVESELRRLMRDNIAHQRMIGSYVGRRHAMYLPVRGQRTQSNAKTARKLNKVERRN